MSQLVQTLPGAVPRLLGMIRKNPAQIIVLMGIVLFALVDERFLTMRNLANIGSQASFILILALAQTVVLIGRGFDLSMGNAVSLISVAMAMVMTGMVGAGWTGGGAVVLGIATSLAIGLTVGMLIGFFSGMLGANSFIISLGMMNVCYGIAAVISGGRPVFNVPLEFVGLFNSGSVLFLPAPIVIAAVICLAVHLLLTKTVYGRLLYLAGSNPQAVRVAGHDTRRILAWSFVIAGALVAISAMLLTARTGTGEPNLGANLLLQAIASAVIGGVSLSGGRGTVWQAIFGTLIIAVLSNALNLMQVSGYVQQITLGAVIIFALWLERIRPQA